MYIPLKVKTDYSLLSSLIKVKDLINFCIKQNISICGICDTNLFSSIEFYTLCHKNNIKPIIGLELKINNHRLFLYAKNYDGYKNLLKINTIIGDNDLTIYELKNYHRNLIAVIPYEDKEIYEDIKTIVDEVYLSYQDNFEKQNALLITKNVVYLNDIVCFNSEDIKYLKYLDMLREEEVTYKNYFINKDILPDDEEILSQFASLINIEIPFNNRYIPKFREDIDSYKYLYELAHLGLKKRCQGNVSDKYIQRLNYELDVINKMGFVDYFLIVYDYVLFAKKNHILVGPGRGSAAGSLVSYSIGITDIDPVKYDLMFERFLNVDRVTMPDIDIDFDNTKRDEVINYVKEKYGDSHVSGGLTYSTLKTRLVIREIGKLLKIDNHLINKFLQVINRDLSLKDNLKNEYVNKYLNSYEELKNLYDISLHLEGLKKNVSTHAAGIVIADRCLDEIIPMYKKENVYLTGITMEYLEDLGLLKMDFLALKNLSIISHIIDKIPEFNLNKINLEDEEVYRLFASANTDGIFQFETNAFKSVLPKFKPSNFNDLIACIALVRPGPSKELDKYIKRKHNKEEVTYLIPELKPILESTYGVIIYQEQVIAILNKMANFSNSEADSIRKAMSKKKSELLNSYQQEFIKRSVMNGYDKGLAEEIYKQILEFAGYGFNKAHSVSYATVSYQMAYLKVHYNLLFTFELLNDSLGSEYKMKTYLNELKNKGAILVKPTLNYSTNEFIMRDKFLYLPFKMIKNLGKEIVDQILEEKEKGKFTSIYDVFERLDLSKKSYEVMIKAEMFKEFELNVQTLMNNLDVLMNYGNIARSVSGVLKPELEIYEEYSDDTLRENEISSYGFYISNHPASHYLDKNIMKIEQMEKFLFKNVNMVIIIEDVKKIKTKNNEDMAFIKGSDETGVSEFTVFPKTFNLLNDIKKNDLVKINGKVSKRFDKVSIIINNLTKIKE